MCGYKSVYITTHNITKEEQCKNEEYMKTLLDLNYFNFNLIQKDFR